MVKNLGHCAITASSLSQKTYLSIFSDYYGNDQHFDNEKRYARMLIYIIQIQ